ncbi:RNA-dependent RNA polymerase [Mycena indigotica]|uniref:RNA-dependent RNA polymerase n=1 Tax=Mycena indigotica TaxID=2126181 RepID=A0A8H6S024_9AGAR|nr:RNA-dependent RNA polymerase [Mycena indigotica]KAF7290166.1 RNA-dependent RNA polymerase [Mycena indigotica]
MQKFDSPLRGLGVMKVSGFAPAHLNRQAICIMEALGVDITKLMGSYQQQIQRAENIERDFAVLDTGRHPARHLYKNAFVPVLKMVKAGLGSEVLLQNVLACLKCQMLRELKYKARVLVNGGAYLIGVADEYDVLEEGQIYCAVTPQGQQHATGYNWAMHHIPLALCPPRRRAPGYCRQPRALRKVPSDERGCLQREGREARSAIYVRGLEISMHITDISQAGWYVLVSMVIFSHRFLSIKAETWMVTFSPSFTIPTSSLPLLYTSSSFSKLSRITREYEPMDYSPVEQPVKKDNISIQDVQDFVVEYITGDVLGMVSNFHAAVADYLGPMSPQCLELAKRASDAVDFAKSGVPVLIEESMRPIRFPDFMDKGAHESYKSTKVLGMMYRMIEPAPTYEPSVSGHFDTRLVRKRVLGHYLQRAGQMKHNYDVDMEGLMRQHNLCEAEIIAGVSVMSEQRKRRAADDAMRGPVREGMEAIRATYRRQARAFVKENPSGGGMEGWAIAAYQVTHVADMRHRYVDALNQSRLGSAAVSMSGHSAYDDWEDDDQAFSDVSRKEMISFPWLWAQGKSQICFSLEDHDVIKEEEEPESEDEERDEERHWIEQWRKGADDSDSEDVKKPFADLPPTPVAVPARHRMTVPPVMKREEPELALLEQDKADEVEVADAISIHDSDDESDTMSGSESVGPVKEEDTDGIEYLRTTHRIFDVDE